MSTAKMIRRSGVKLKFAPEQTGAPGALVSIGSPKGNIRITDGRSTITVDSFDAAIGAFQQQLTDARTGQVSFTTNLIPDDAGYTALKTAYEADQPGYLQITGESIDGTATVELGFKVFISQFDHDFNTTNVAECAVTVVIDSTHEFNGG